MNHTTASPLASKPLGFKPLALKPLAFKPLVFTPPPANAAAHARLSPSASLRWLGCPASIKLSEQIPERGAGAAAQAGTLMHTVIERRLHGGHHLTRDELQVLQQLGVSELRARQIVDQSVQAARKALAKYDLREMLTERRVDPGARIGRSDLWGTADLIGACATRRILLVGDHKTGKSPVGAEGNTQLLCYVAGALDLLSFEPELIVIGVFQPPVYGSEPCLWEVDLQTVLAFEHVVRAQAALTDQPDVAPRPSEQACMWCRARAICPAFSHPDWQ